MQRPFTIAFVLALGAHLGAFGCGNQCIDLAEKICRCEPTESDQRACLQRVDIEAGRPGRDPDEAALSTCESLMESCTCDSLADGDFAACGLSLE